MLYPQGTGGSPRLQRGTIKKSFKGSKTNTPASATSDPLLRVEFELTEFAPETFKLLMEYAHTGAVLLQVGGSRVVYAMYLFFEFAARQKFQEKKRPLPNRWTRSWAC
jgi:hypothetical protein